MKTKTAKALKRTFLPQLKKCMLAILCVALVASLTPSEGLAEAAEELVSSISASDASSGDDGVSSEDTEAAETTEDTADTGLTDTTETDGTDDAEESVLSEDSTDDSSFALTDTETLLAGVETLAVNEAANESDFAYISSFSIGSIADGTGSFDTCTAEPGEYCETHDTTDCDYYYLADGNDESAKNGRVRTFDTVTYTLNYIASSYDDTNGFGSSTVYLYFEFILPMSSTEAMWDTDEMNWLDSNTTSYTTSTKTVSYDFTGTGSSQGVSCQVITGYRAITVDSTSTESSGSLDVTLRVLASSNGEKVTPVFSMWIGGNEADGTSLAEIAESENNVVANNITECSEHEGVVEQQTIAANKDFDETSNNDYAVTVTCAPRYNVQLKRTDTSYDTEGTFDFTTGTSGLALDSEAGSSVEGSLTSYGVTIQLYNHSGCGLKGIEIPTGNITFEIELSTVFVDDEDNEYDLTNTEFASLVYSWGPQQSAIYDGRDSSPLSAAYAVYAAPGNSGMTISRFGGYTSCYNGGTWSATKTYGDNTISVTVSNYAIEYPLFPNTDLGRPTATSTYFSSGLDITEAADTIRIGCFSAGKFFIVTPQYDSDGDSVAEYLSEQEGTEITDGNIQLTVTVTNIEIDVDGDGQRKVGETTATSVANTVSADNSRTATIVPMGTAEASYSYATAWTSPNGDYYYDVLGRNYFDYTSPSTTIWATNGQDAIPLGSRHCRHEIW